MTAHFDSIVVGPGPNRTWTAGAPRPGSFF
jgi:hypothetical protein